MAAARPNGQASVPMCAKAPARTRAASKAQRRGISMARAVSSGGALASALAHYFEDSLWEKNNNCCVLSKFRRERK